MFMSGVDQESAHSGESNMGAKNSLTSEVNKLKKLNKLNKLNKYSVLHDHLARMKDNSLSGLLFEKFVMAHLELQTGHKCHHINDLPPRIAKATGLSGDYGVDIIIEDTAGMKFYPVQAKYRATQRTISWSKDALANFFAETKDFDHRVIVTSAKGIDAHSKKKYGKNLTLIARDSFEELSDTEFRNVIKRMCGSSRKAPQKKKMKPRDYQRTALRNAKKHFITQGSDRGQMIAACGWGKNAFGPWVADSLEAKIVLVCVPSLQLIRQNLKTWRSENTGKQGLDYLVVCGEKDIDKTEYDKASLHSMEINAIGKVTSDPKVIRSFLNEKTGRQKLVITTYQSLKQVASAQKNTSLRFDLGIADEAHKTAGARDRAFALFHKEKEIKVDKRIYLTATPKILGGYSSKQAKKEAQRYVADMSNEKIFGKIFYSMSFCEAIDRKILSDYEIRILAVTDKDVQKIIRNKNFRSRTGYTATEIANAVGFLKILKKQGLNHAISFHHTVNNAKRFQRVLEEVRGHMDLEVYHVNGSMPTRDRLDALSLFEDKKTGAAIITNARCLTEGVDIPKMDCVFFSDNKQSVVDIAQSIGRILRRHPGKKKGVVVVPIYNSKMESVEDVVAAGNFKTVINVLRAMGANDSRIEETIRLVDENGGYDGGSRDAVITKLVKLDGIKEMMQEAVFDMVLAKTVNGNIKWTKSACIEDAQKYKTRSEWDNQSTGYNAAWKNGWLEECCRHMVTKTEFLPFGEARARMMASDINTQVEFRKASREGRLPEGIPVNPHRKYKNEGWVSWGDFLRGEKKAEFLPFKDARKIMMASDINTQAEFNRASREGRLPEGIPGEPRRKYKNEGWDGMPDFLCGGSRFLPFGEAR
ncbi:MAG: hypothetical protein CL504_08515, partial [Actinobacteria bacterium]|nr:hypothetical protein [Actinomycetota bacterium]